jgi:hypothetical protein
MFENKILRKKYLEQKGTKAAGESRKLHNEKFNEAYSSKHTVTQTLKAGIAGSE